MKRATYDFKTTKTAPEDFNPRPREEGDFLLSILSSPLPYFNPRPREEGDPAPARGSAKPNDFNPRPREEGDIYYIKYK